MKVEEGTINVAHSFEPTVPFGLLIIPSHTTTTLPQYLRRAKLTRSGLVAEVADCSSFLQHV